MKSVDIDYLKSILTYEKETGLIRWKIRPVRSKKKTDIAGTLLDGYVVIVVSGKALKAHRVAWALTFNEWPKGLIDHINGNRSDNRIDNLRTGTQTQNLQNKRSALPSSKSGLIGAMFDNSTGRFRARIRSNGKRINLGSFSTQDEAHFAYLKAKREMHEFCSI